MDIDALIDEYSDYLFRIAFIYTKDIFLAEEVVQDVFFKFYTHTNFKGHASVKTYLTKMTINRSIDCTRSLRYKTMQLFDHFTTTSVEEQLIETEQRQEITAAVLTLPLKYRQVLLHYYYEDLSVQQIATLCDLPLSTVKSRLQRARHKLKDQLPHISWEVLQDA